MYSERELVAIMAERQKAEGRSGPFGPAAMRRYESAKHFDTEDYKKLPRASNE